MVDVIINLAVVGACDKAAISPPERWFQVWIHVGGVEQRYQRFNGSFDAARKLDPDRSEEGWFTLLRLYSPLPSFFDKSWRLSEIEPVESIE